MGDTTESCSTNFGTVTIPVSTEDTGTKSVGATELCSAQEAWRHWEHRRLQRRKSYVDGTRINSINTTWMEPENKVENKQMWDVKTGFEDKPEAGSRILQPHEAEAVSSIQKGMNQEGFGKILEETPGYNCCSKILLPHKSVCPIL